MTQNIISVLTAMRDMTTFRPSSSDLLKTLAVLDETLSLLTADKIHGLPRQTQLGKARDSFARLIIDKKLVLTAAEKQIWENFKELEGNQSVKNGLFASLLAGGGR